ncbi:MAG: DNA gyrase inhibitor YacG [Myxococcales bacterium]|nr:DNA gyrase inhibitor YacG [Myxococcales bacterium]MCB9543265.1 DNA gyrase inhibitor YacG [Myxococcales bacterium]
MSGADDGRRIRRCPVCGEPAAARAENPAFPFCRARCREIDLGRWFAGDYVVSRPLSPDLDPGAEPVGDPGGGPDDHDS